MASRKLQLFMKKDGCIHDEAKRGSDIFEEVYKFYLDIAPHAWEIYQSWKEHQGFNTTWLRSIERDGRKVVEVPDGLIFPILAALAQFAEKTKQGWKIKQPKELEDMELIAAAKSAYMDIAKSKPEIMGKSRPCYSALEQITSIYKKLLAKA